jgi:hypothetical protein
MYVRGYLQGSENGRVGHGIINPNNPVVILLSRSSSESADRGRSIIQVMNLNNTAPSIGTFANITTGLFG